jgi:hypothetical protein
MKSERLKKLEAELQDLKQWLKLGLVPKKDIEKHKEEIRILSGKVEEEKERLRFLKENGEIEEYVTPKKAPPRQVYPEAHTLSDMEMGMESSDTGFETESEGYDETQVDSTEFNEDNTQYDFEEDDPFSDKNRWKRGILEDPDSDNW